MSSPVCPDAGSLLHCPTSSDTVVHLQPFLYGSAELGDDLLKARTPDYCSARDNHVSTSLRGEGRRGGRGGEGGEKGGEKGRMEREEKREGKKGEWRGRREKRGERENEEGEEK